MKEKIKKSAKKRWVQPKIRKDKVEIGKTLAQCTQTGGCTTSGGHEGACWPSDMS